VGEDEVVEEELMELALMELELESVMGPLDVVKGIVELMLVCGIGTLEAVAVVEEPRNEIGLLELGTLEPAIMELELWLVLGMLDVVPALEVRLAMLPALSGNVELLELKLGLVIET